MNNDLMSFTRQLRKGEVLRLDDDSEGRRVEILGGPVWVTIDNDLRDIVVAGGQGFTIDRPGLVLVSALADASVMMLEMSERLVPY